MIYYKYNNFKNLVFRRRGDCDMDLSWSYHHEWNRKGDGFFLLGKLQLFVSGLAMIFFSACFSDCMATYLRLFSRRWLLCLFPFVPLEQERDFVKTLFRCVFGFSDFLQRFVPCCGGMSEPAQRFGCCCDIKGQGRRRESIYVVFCQCRNAGSLWRCVLYADRISDHGAGKGILRTGCREISIFWQGLSERDISGKVTEKRWTHNKNKEGIFYV